MNLFKTFFLALLGIACAPDSQQVHNSSETVKIESSKKIEEQNSTIEPYSIDFQIETTKNSTHRLAVTMNLDSLYCFIGPHSKGSFLGEFNISIKDNDHLAIVGPLEEKPKSYVTGYVNLVKVNTTYKQELNIKSNTDFEVNGLVLFAIKPNKTLEKVEFMISYHSGEMKIKRLDKQLLPKRIDD